MKYEIELTAYHSTLLKKISEYSEIDVNKLIKYIIVNHIEDFDNRMQDFIEQNIPDEYYDEFTGRYVE